MPLDSNLNRPLTTPAVIVVDMLQDYFDANLWPGSSLPEREEILTAATNQLTTAARKAGAPVVWVRQEFSEDLSDAFPHMIRDGRSYVIKGSEGCSLLPGLLTDSTDHEIVKKRFSAFFATNLDQLLKEAGISTVLLAGITTPWCIRSTATDAYQLGYTVLLVEECLAGFQQDAHQNSMAEMDNYIATVRSLAETVALLS